MINIDSEYQVMTTIKVSEFFGNIMAYRGMSEETFNRLSEAYLKHEETIEITQKEYDNMIVWTDQ